MKASPRDLSRRIALAAYTALLALIVVWELWLAPATPVSRAFWLALKGVPLLIALPGLWRGSARVYVLTALLMLLYFSDAIADVYHAAKTADAPELGAGLVQLVASLIFIAAAPIYARLTWRDPPALARRES